MLPTEIASLSRADIVAVDHVTPGIVVWPNCTHVPGSAHSGTLIETSENIPQCLLHSQSDLV